MIAAEIGLFIFSLLLVGYAFWRDKNVAKRIGAIGAAIFAVNFLAYDLGFPKPWSNAVMYIAVTVMLLAWLAIMTQRLANLWKPTRMLRPSNPVSESDDRIENNQG